MNFGNINWRSKELFFGMPFSLIDKVGAVFKGVKNVLVG